MTTSNYIIKLILLTLVLFCSVSLYGQNAKVVELEKQLAEHTSQDTVRVNILTRLVSLTYVNDVEQAKVYAKESLELATQLNIPKAKAAGLWATGLTYLRQDKSRAMEYFQQVLALVEKQGDKMDVYTYSMSLGNEAALVGEKELRDRSFNRAMAVAVELKDKSLQFKVSYNILAHMHSGGDTKLNMAKLDSVVLLAIEVGDSLMLVRCYGLIGATYKRHGNLRQALAYYHKALRISEQQKDTGNYIANLCRIASIHLSLKELDEALRLFFKGLEQAKQIQHTEHILSCQANIAYTYWRMNNPKALEWYQAVLATTEGRYDNRSVNALVNIAQIHTSNGDFALAHEHLDQALPLAEKTDRKRSLAMVWSAMSHLYYQEKQYSQARIYGYQALEAEEDLGNLASQRTMRQLLADIDAAMGNYQQAYLNHVQFKVLADSLLNEENIRQIAQMASQYEFDKEKQVYEVEKATRELKISNQRQVIISLVAITLLILLLSFLLYRSNRLKKRVLSLEIESINRELEHNQKEMAVATLKLIQSSDSDAYCVKMLEDIEHKAIDDGKREVSSLINYYKYKSNTSNWEEFETLFAKVNSEFYATLNERYPDLTPNERKLCVFLKLNMASKDIAQITFQSEEALKKARLRLRKKLDLDREINLTGFIQGL